MMDTELAIKDLYAMIEDLEDRVLELIKRVEKLETKEEEKC